MLNVITGEVESNQLVVVHVIILQEYEIPCISVEVLKVMQLLEEAPFGFEEVDALLTSVKNSASEGLLQISCRRIQRLLTLIVGSPLFF